MSDSCSPTACLYLLHADWKSAISGMDLTTINLNGHTPSHRAHEMTT